MTCIKLVLWTLLMLALSGFMAAAHAEVPVLASFPSDSLDKVISKDNVSVDKETTSSGKGSFKMVATEPTVFRLFESTLPTLENARLIYSARLKTLDAKGKVVLEMWVHFPGKGEFFSRGLQDPLTGTTDWTSVETPFFLQAGEKPDRVKLNVMFTGSGTAWVDEIRLIKGPLK